MLPTPRGTVWATAGPMNKIVQRSRPSEIPPKRGHCGVLNSDLLRRGTSLGLGRPTGGRSEFGEHGTAAWMFLFLGEKLGWETAPIRAVGSIDAGLCSPVLDRQSVFQVHGAARVGPAGHPGDDGQLTQMLAAWQHDSTCPLLPLEDWGRTGKLLWFTGRIVTARKHKEDRNRSSRQERG